MTHPYVEAAPHQRWRSAMVQPSPGDVDPVVAAPFRISSTDAIATAGSCFALNVTRRLRAAGLRHLETETAHPILSAETAQAFNYGQFSARYGLIYTSRQLLQLLRRAYGRFQPSDDIWPDDEGRLFDPFRPTIQLGGFTSPREYALDRARHFAAVRAMFQSVDVFIFTLGLTECWSAKADGAVYPLCPGVAAGRFDPERHVLLNLSAQEIVEDLDAFLTELRAVNPGALLILTVSPVPLAATAEPRHVWTSTTLSKATLRVAAEEIARRPGVAYFPAYEVITSPAARGAYFEEDLRSVSSTGVDHVMRLFFRHMVETGACVTPPAADPVGDHFLMQSKRALDELCDEARLDPVASPSVQARSLAEAGRYREAIDLLAQERSDDIDFETLRDLVRWRHAAFSPETGRPTWPPELPDPFPGAPWPPEIRGAELTADVLGGAIQHHGCLLVRGIIDAEQTRKLAEIVTGACEAALTDASETLNSPWYAPYPLDPNDGMSPTGRAFGARSGSVWTADSPRGLSDFIAFLKAHGVSRAIEDYLGERAYLSIGKSSLRRVPATIVDAGWHQDGAFLGGDIRTVNLWLALSDCGDDAPGLDLYPRRLDHLVESGTPGAYASWMVSPDVVAKLAKTAPIVAPLFKAGDALLFDQLLLHRTGGRRGMTRDRLAIESWFFAGSTFPMKQMPIAI